MALHELAITTAKRLPGLGKMIEISNWVEGNELTAAAYLETYGKLIDMFNNIQPDDVDLIIMPKTEALLQLLNGAPLPTLDELQSRVGTLYYAQALEDAEPALLQGVVNNLRVQRGETVSEENTAFAINAASLDVPAETLFIGVLAHLGIERPMFVHLSKLGFAPHDGWQKDCILHVLNEISLREYAKGKFENPLLPFFTLPNSKGGLGWLIEERVEEFVDDYESLHEEPF